MRLDEVILVDKILKKEITSEQNKLMCSTCPDEIKTCDGCPKCDIGPSHDPNWQGEL